MINYSKYISLVTPSYARAGNCLFQLAAAIAHGEQYHTPIKVHVAGSTVMRDIFDYLDPDLEFIERIPTVPRTAYYEVAFTYVKIPAFAVNGALDGYFQSEKYFMDKEHVIRTVFSKLIAPKRMGTVGVHIRLGDYLEHSHIFKSPDVKFLAEALKRISEHIKELVIFSDDPEAAVKLVGSIPEAQRFTISVDAHTTLDAIRELSAMEELIISCSSFSWWGAWLGDQDNVFVQHPWFNDPRNPDYDIYRDKWTKIYDFNNN